MKLPLLALAICATCFADGHFTCKTSDVSGTYAFLANGSVLIPGLPISGPFSRVGTLTADGKGAIHISTLALYNGLNFGLESFDGTYTVTSDCGLDMIVAVPAPVHANAEFKGPVAGGGDDVTFLLVNTDGPPAISTVVGFGRLRDLKSCSNGTVAGGWRMEINGYKTLQATPTPYRQVGKLQLDGHGGLLASFITSNGGLIASETGAGTYTVGADCVFDLNYTIGTTPYSIRGSVVNSEEADLALNMPGDGAVHASPFGPFTISGAVATGTMVRETGSSPSRNDHGRD